jgi:AraC-like DNA-binding protein/mannose-6-phosphate isomerase-like protein (cupin superfamily)
MQSGSKRALFEHVRHDRDLGILFRDVTGPALQFPWHFHPELELTYIVRGAGQRYVGDSIEPFDAGDLCLVGASTPHCWLTEQGDPGPVHAYVIQFLPESISASLAHTPTFRPLVQLFERARRGLLVGGVTRQRAAELMRELFTVRTRPLDRYVGLLSILTDLSESEHLSELALVDAPPPADAQTTEVAAKLLGFIHEHATDAALSFNQVARAAGMSRATLGRVFPKLFGRTFAKYLAEVRVVKACALLSETERSVAEIAVETGFGSVSNFNRRFLSLKGTSPLRYRRSASERVRAAS